MGQEGRPERADFGARDVEPRRRAVPAEAKQVRRRRREPRVQVECRDAAS
jgi:hypothetical protein